MEEIPESEDEQSKYDPTEWALAEELAKTDGFISLWAPPKQYRNWFIRLARAILSERARCAKLAKAMLVFADTTSGADEAIPQAIMDPNHWLAKNPERAAELAP
jgi:hypothetical protein